MAVLALGAVGAIIGGGIGASIGATGLGIGIGYSVGSMFGGMLFPSTYPSTNIVNEGTQLDKTMIQTSAYGKTITKGFGVFATAGNCIYASELRETKHASSQTASGGKGGGGGSQTVTNISYTYALDCAIMVCLGPIIGIRRIWADTKLVYSAHEDADTDTDEMSELVMDGMTIYTGTYDQNPDPLMEAALGVGMVPGYRGIAYVVFENLDVTNTGGRVPNFVFEVATKGKIDDKNHVVPENPTLAEIVEELITDNTNLTINDLYLDDLTKTIVGYQLNNQCSVRSALEPLFLATYVDGFESEGLLKFTERGKAPVLTLNHNDLVPYQESDESIDLYVMDIVSEQELPKRISVTAMNPNNDYNTVTGSYSRHFSLSRKESSQTFGITLCLAQCASIAEVLCHVTWTQRKAVKFKTDLRYLKLDPADVIRIVTNTNEYTLRITSIIFSIDEGISFETVLEDSDIYNSVSEGALESTQGINIVKPGTPIIEIMDIPLLLPDHVQAGLYMAATTVGEWKGCIIRTGTTTNPEDSWTVVWMKDRATMGYAIGTPLSAVRDPYIIEEVTLRVYLYGGELESITKDEMLAGGGKNFALYKNEIIQFRDAVLVSANTYDLTGIYSGRLGTEGEMSGHAINDRFVLLDANLHRWQTTDYPALLGKTRYFFGANVVQQNPSLKGFYALDPTYQIIDYTSPYSLTVAMRSLKPLSPRHIRGYRNNDGDLAITWKRRDRMASIWMDYTDIPCSEWANFEYTLGFRVRIMDGVNVKRTLSVLNASSVVYTAAQQMEDFGAVQASVDVLIAQQSQNIGYGIEGSAVI
jgi:hypothetical protein